MDPLLLFGLAALVVVVIAVLVASRNRRDASLEPTRLGPAWTPPAGEDGAETADPETRKRRITEVAARTEADESTVSAVLDIWDEYLGVLGLAPLAAGHRRQVYDPYDPPVARRGPDGRPEPDGERVARDVANRLGIDETLTLRIIEADTDPAAA
jgi:hypothetical protein